VPVIETLKHSLGVAQDHSKWYHSNFDSLCTVSYSDFITNMAVFLAVSIQYTNVTDAQPDTA